jgi:hypothetical protein
VKTYADTSLLFSLYSTDANSPKADAWRTANPDPLPFTAFHRVSPPRIAERPESGRVSEAADAG